MNFKNSMIRYFGKLANNNVLKSKKTVGKPKNTANANPFNHIAGQNSKEYENFVKSKGISFYNDLEKYHKKISLSPSLDSEVIEWLNKKGWYLEKINDSNWCLKKNLGSEQYNFDVQIKVLFRIQIMTKEEMGKQDEDSSDKIAFANLPVPKKNILGNKDTITKEQKMMQNEIEKDNYFFENKTDFLVFVDFGGKKARDFEVGKFVPPMDLGSLDPQKGDWGFYIKSEDGTIDIESWFLTDAVELEMRRNDALNINKNWFGNKGLHLPSLTDEVNILIYEMVTNRFGITEDFVKAIEYLTISRYREFEESYLNDLKLNLKAFLAI